MARQTRPHRRVRDPRLVAIVLLLVAGLAPVMGWNIPQATASHTTIKLPFLGTGAWYAWEGYNFDPINNGTHWDCDASTGLDEADQFIPCRPYYIYKYSFDLRRVDEQTSFQTVVAPASGTICWIDSGFGGAAIDFGDGIVFAYFHTRIAGGLTPGQFVSQGQFLGVVAPPGEAGNGGIAHLHINLWRSWSCGGGDRVTEPFTGDHKLDGLDFPALADSVQNQHVNAQMSSTNGVTGAKKPTTPVLQGPPNGSTTNTATPFLSWGVSTRAVEYQVVIDGGAVSSPYIAGRSWRPPDLPPGTHTWQVRGRNPLSTGSLSAAKSFVVPDSVARVELSPGEGMVNTLLELELDGFQANEGIDLRWDSSTGAVVKRLTANGAGSIDSTLRVPKTVVGHHTLIAIGRTSGRQASAPFLLNRARVIADPNEGKVGTIVDVRAYGFGADEPVFVAWDDFITDFGDSLADGAGNFRVFTRVPELPAGVHRIDLIGEETDQRGRDTFTVIPTMSMSPGSGPAGTTVTVRGKGWPANSQVNVSWTRVGGGASTSVCQATTNTLGSFTCKFTAPAGSGGLQFRVRAISSGYSSSKTFTLNGASTADLLPSPTTSPTTSPTVIPESTSTATPPEAEPTAEPTIESTPPMEPTEFPPPGGSPPAEET